MKIHYKKIQTISLLLSLIFLFQSCYVYHKTPISLDEAVAANKKMKVTTTEAKTYRFMKIEKTDSTYYGHTQVRNQTVKVPLQKEKIQGIRPVNKGASTLLTIGAFVIPVSFVVLLIVSNSGEDDNIFYPSTIPFPNLEPF